MPRSKPSGEQHLTVAELAHRLNVTTDYLYREVIGQENGIVPIRLGSGPRARLRIPRSEVDRWEQSRRVCYSSIRR